MIVRWYHCVITSYDPPIHLTYQLSFSANRVTLCCKSFTTFVVWRNSYGALCGWVVASARCQQSKAHAPLTSLQIEISSPSLPTLLPQGWHSIFCQLINQSTYNTTYTNNTRSIVYHSPRMQHHWTASTFHDSTRGTKTQPNSKDSNRQRHTHRLAKEGHVDISCCAFETCNARDQVFCVEVLDVLRRWVFHTGIPPVDPKKAYFHVKKNVACRDNGPKQKTWFWFKMPKKGGGDGMEKSTKNCWHSWIFQKSPAHKIMICVIALQMQWQAKANLWWQVTNTKNWHFKSAVSKENKGNITTVHYTFQLLPKVVDVSISQNYISWGGKSSSPIRRSALPPIGSSLWFLAQISSWTKAL